MRLLELTGLLLLSIGAATLSSSAAETDFELELASGYNDNISNAAAGSSDAIGSPFIEPALSLETTWIPAPRHSLLARIEASSQLFLNPSISGNVELRGSAEYGRAFLAEDLRLTLGYGLVDSIGIAVPFGPTGGGNNNNPVSATFEGGIAEPYLQNSVSLKGKYDLGKLQLGSQIDGALKSVTDSARQDRTLRILGNISAIPLEPLYLRFGAGIKSVASNDASYAYDAPLFDFMAMLQASDDFSLLGGLSLESRDYSSSGTDANVQSYSLGIENELSETFSLGFSLFLIDSAGSEGGATFSSTELSAGLRLSY